MTTYFGHWKLYISPTNGEVTANGIDALIDLEIIEEVEEVELPNSAPTLAGGEVSEIAVGGESSSGEVKVSLPEVYDPNSDEFTVEVLNLIPGVTYDSSSHMIVIDMD